MMYIWSSSTNRKFLNRGRKWWIQLLLYYNVDDLTADHGEVDPAGWVFSHCFMDVFMPSLSWRVVTLGIRCGRRSLKITSVLQRKPHSSHLWSPHGWYQWISVMRQQLLKREELKVSGLISNQQSNRAQVDSVSSLELALKARLWRETPLTDYFGYKRDCWD